MLKLIFIAVLLLKASYANISFSTDFESGSMGFVTQGDNNNEWYLYLRDDDHQYFCNKQPAENNCLPDNWRSWFNIKLNYVPLDIPVTLHFSNNGWTDLYNPVYSYNGENWQRFPEAAISSQSCDNGSRPDLCQITVTYQFEQADVQIARFYPYTYTQLENYLASLSDYDNVDIDIIGYSFTYKKPLYQLTISDKTIAEQDKKFILMHARTHPGETGGSFVLQGLINFLLTEDNESAAQLLRQYVFVIVPMHNVDGVIEGNYRSTALSPERNNINLEASWWFDPDNAVELLAEAPLENHILNQTMKNLLGKDLILAINLHSSNSKVETGAFFYPHFGSQRRYNHQQRQLWHNQLAFINVIAENYGGLIQPPPANGGSGFYDRCVDVNANNQRLCYPESWWWHNKREQINAITLETTYGKAGFDYWINQHQLYQLGEALGLAIYEYGQALDDNTIEELLALEPFKLPYDGSIY